MIHSMTGYSEARRETGDFSLVVSVKSLNHRYLDIQVRLPFGLDSLEAEVRRAVKNHILRGRVEIGIGLERLGAAEIPIDRKLLQAYVSTYRELSGALNLASEPDLVSLLRLPGVIAPPDGKFSPEDMERLRQALGGALEEALAALNAMREREGETLERDFQARLDRLSSWIEEAARLAAQVSGSMGQRLEQRVRDLLGSVEVDRSRLAEEVAYLVSRSDIAEEVTRFRSHLEQARRFLKQGTEIGKKLDFLLQELNREANTMLSKTSDVPAVGMALSQRAIDMKAEIEKLREQVQNIE